MVVTDLRERQDAARKRGGLVFVVLAIALIVAFLVALGRFAQEPVPKVTEPTLDKETHVPGSVAKDISPGLIQQEMDIAAERLARFLSVGDDASIPLEMERVTQATDCLFIATRAWIAPGAGAARRASEQAIIAEWQGKGLTHIATAQRRLAIPVAVQLPSGDMSEARAVAVLLGGFC